MADLAAFANVRGGTLYLGVNKAGAVIGCDTSDERQQEIANKVAAHLGLVPDIRTEAVAGASMLAIHIERAARPIQLRGSYWRRSGTVSMKVPQEEWSRLALAHVGQSWDGLATDATVESDIDPVKVIAFVRSARAKPRPRLPERVSDNDPIPLILGNLGLLIDDRPTNAALLLFGREPQHRCRSALISIAYFRTISDFDVYPDCAGTIFEQIEAAQRVVAQATPSRVTFIDEESLRPSARATVDVVERTRRQETPTYPELAVKEAVTNAVVHRDFARIGTEVQIRIYPERLVIMSPGALPSGVTTESLRQDPHRSERRNPLIAETCFIDYWVERYGTGTTRMIELYHEAGLPEPEFIAEPEGFTVVFRRHAWTRDRLATFGLSGRQVNAILELRSAAAITTSAYMQAARVSESTALRDLRDLAKRGILVARGRGRTAHYVLV